MLLRPFTVFLGLLLMLGAVSPRTALARGPKMSEEERQRFEAQQVEQAALACKGADHRAFVNLFIQSQAVRRAFTMERVDYAEAGGAAAAIPRTAYDRFPIRMVDFQWRPAAPLKRGDQDEHILTTLSLTKANSILVEWTRVHYRAPFSGEENLGTPYDVEGKRYDPQRPGHGTLLFLAKDGCWFLAGDTRRSRR